MDKDKIYKSKSELLSFLNIKENFLYPSFSKKYGEFDLPKKNGGTRPIKPPHPKLKTTQRAILDKILYSSAQLPCVYGLSSEKGVRVNAEKHLKNAKVDLLTLDIEKFFPSITPKQVLNVFMKLGFNKENSRVLTKICTVDDSLPQGAPTSPYLASLVCLSLDKQIYNYCRRRNFEYTRYFDDITISGCKITKEEIAQIRNILKRNSFVSNDSKLFFYDSKTANKIITGVLLKPTGLSVPREYKAEIEDAYIRWTRSSTINDKRKFEGKFAFYLYINKPEALALKKYLSKMHA